MIVPQDLKLLVLFGIIIITEAKKGQKILKNGQWQIVGQSKKSGQKRLRTTTPVPTVPSRSPGSQKLEEAIEVFKNRKEGWHSYVTTLMKKKSLIAQKIEDSITQINNNADLLPAEKKLHVIRFRVWQEQLHETENLIISSLRWLQESTENNIKKMDIGDMIGSSKTRLEKLRDATLNEEERFSMLTKAQVIMS